LFGVTLSDIVIIPANSVSMVGCKIAGKVRFGCVVAFQPNLLLDPALSCPEFVVKEEKIFTVLVCLPTEELDNEVRCKM